MPRFSHVRPSGIAKCQNIFRFRIIFMLTSMSLSPTRACQYSGVNTSSLKIESYIHGKQFECLLILINIHITYYFKKNLKLSRSDYANKGSSSAYPSLSGSKQCAAVITQRLFNKLALQ